MKSRPLIVLALVLGIAGWVITPKEREKSNASSSDNNTATKADSSDNNVK